ncbi:MAG: glycosyltransferase family 2 protein [Bacteroidaceae bacterium]|nr:glycosyltransferase family 2 protein [Bacteroidaceae bacterium]
MISIIVPVYNAEQYIHRCVDSILVQSFTDFELLLIDDGSPDNCGAICDEYAAKDSRVRVLHKENGGVSTARNLGIDQAQGEWVTFIDADDYVHPDFLSSLYAQHSVDLIVGSFQSVGSDETWNGILEENNYDASALKENIVSLYSLINFRTPWSKLFRTNIIRENRITFDKRIHIGEDSLFVLTYLLYTTSIRLSSKPFYYYERGNTNSLSQSLYSLEHHFFAIEAFDEKLNRLQSIFDVNVQRLQRENAIIYLSKQIDYIYHNRNSLMHKLSCMNLMCENKHLKCLYSDRKTKFRKKIRFFHFFMAHRLSFLSLIYIYLLRGRIYC